MIVTCPECRLTKDLGPVSIPPTGMIATCPRCKAPFEVKPETLEPWYRRWWKPLLAAAVACSMAAVLIAYDWKLDRDYFLRPGAWQGEMTYFGTKYPFELVIEKAQDGKLEGYMDWVGESPRYRLAVRGTYDGNHLVFVDYEFLERQGSRGLHDEKDVYIIGNEMTGTDKNGRARFHALKRESAPF